MEFQANELNEILNIFQQESSEIISSMDEKLLKLEKDSKNKELAMHLFRDAHSLKGSARMLGFNDIQNLAHKIEDIISLIKEEKLKISKEQGAKTMLLSDLKDEDKMSFDVVIEATGSTGGFEVSASLVKPRGTLVLKSTIAAKEGLNLATIVVNEITIVGSRCGQFKPIIKLLENKKINPKPLIDGIYSVEDFKCAFEKNSQKGTLKVLVKF